jgi:sulfatase maturation enzyme AslB (radical SAM superfamily)
MRTITFVGLLLVIFVFSISAEAQAPQVPQTVSEEEVRQFMEKYTGRFMRMDIDTFMDLFSKEAVENRMLPYADIRDAYQKTFANSNAIAYQLEIYSIQAYQKSAFVSGRYALIQSIKGSKKKKVFQGNIQWDLIRENGSLKIKEINYGRDR